MAVKRAKPFASEAELCARFIAAVGPDWTAYNECQGWDILLVRKADGFQIGIEAKLVLNAHVVSQTLEQYGSYYADHPGPDCRAVLVPSTESNGYDLICKYIGLTIIQVYSDEKFDELRKFYRRQERFTPSLPRLAAEHSNRDDWHEWAPGKRHVLPDYVPDVAAGVASPIQLTDWKIRAIKIAVILEKRGFLSRSDFKHLNIDHRRFLPSGAGWLILRDGGYVASMAFPDFKAQHPRVYDEIAADYEKWKPTEPLLLVPPKQGGLL